MRAHCRVFRGGAPGGKRFGGRYMELCERQCALPNSANGSRARQITCAKYRPPCARYCCPADSASKGRKRGLGQWLVQQHVFQFHIHVWATTDMYHIPCVYLVTDTYPWYRMCSFTNQQLLSKPYLISLAAQVGSINIDSLLRPDTLLQITKIPRQKKRSVMIISIYKDWHSLPYLTPSDFSLAQKLHTSINESTYSTPFAECPVPCRSLEPSPRTCCSNLCQLSHLCIPPQFTSGSP